MKTKSQSGWIYFFSHCLCMLALHSTHTHTHMPTCQDYLDYEVQSSLCHSGSLNVFHYTGLWCVLWDLHAEGTDCLKWVPLLAPLSTPFNPTHHVWEAPVSHAVRLRGTPASQENDIVTPERHTRSLLRRQICVQLKCRSFILSALHRGLTFLKLLACDKSISALVNRRPSWRGGWICKYFE